MKNIIEVGNKVIGDGYPIFIIAEIGINHNGSLELAKALIDGAVYAGCDAVKFQKRTPELSVPKEKKDIKRDTPWGKLTNLEYRKKLEFGLNDFEEIDYYCKKKGIMWFASCWDEEAIVFIEQFDVPIHKASSASLVDIELLKKLNNLGKPLILSTGMSTENEIELAVNSLKSKNLLIAQATSSYPSKVEELNLSYIQTLKKKYPEYPIGYSGHEIGLAPTYAAVTLGANFIERHITFDRSMWGTDQAASVEIMGMHELVRNIRDIEKAIGDGVKKIYDSEIFSIKKLRK